jgi:hypothetical protein
MIAKHEVNTLVGIVAKPIGFTLQVGMVAYLVAHSLMV